MIAQTYCGACWSECGEVLQCAPADDPCPSCLRQHVARLEAALAAGSDSPKHKTLQDMAQGLADEVDAAAGTGLDWSWIKKHFALVTKDKIGYASEFNEGVPLVPALWLRSVAIAAAERIGELEAQAAAQAGSVVVPEQDLTRTDLTVIWHEVGLVHHGDPDVRAYGDRVANLGYKLGLHRASRVLGDVEALRRFAERCAQRDHQPDEHIGDAKCIACEAEDALRADKGGAP